MQGINCFSLTLKSVKPLFFIIFLFAVGIQTFSKLWVLTSFYLNREIISKTICINRFDAMPTCKGKCYLQTELQKSEQQEQQLPDFKQKDIQLYCQDSFLNAFSIAALEIKNSNPLKKTNLYAYKFSVSVFHPPCKA